MWADAHADIRRMPEYLHQAARQRTKILQPEPLRTRRDPRRQWRGQLGEKYLLEVWAVIR